MSDRPKMPRLAEIALAWAEKPNLIDLMPELRAHAIGWGEPFCFRCGWLAPVVKEAGDYPTDWPAPRAITATWNSASGWLERAHLQDHQHGGGNEPLDLVPMCPLCHEAQPTCETRAGGLAFLNTRAEHADVVWLAQVYTDIHCRRPRPGRSHAINSLLRAYAAVGMRAVPQGVVA